MGVCVSKQQGCMRVRNKKHKHNNNNKDHGPPDLRNKNDNNVVIKSSRRRGRRRRLVGGGGGGGGRNKRNPYSSSSRSTSKVDPSSDNHPHHHPSSFSNPTFHGSTEWFDTATGLESDGDDDFYSTHDDIASQSSSVSATVTPRVSDHVTGSSFSTTDSLAKPTELPPANGSFGIQNNCLPCLTCTTSTEIKSKSSCSSPQSAKKKSSSRLSFKWREGQSNLSIISPRATLQRPIAGSQVPFCPIEKKMSDCWSPLDPSSFKVRGRNYLRANRMLF